MDNLTKTVGIYVRDILRADSTFKTILGITAHPENFIFYTEPSDQHKAFNNPRVIIYSAPSTAGTLGNSDIYQGQELYQITIFSDDDLFNTSSDALDRIVTLFSEQTYLFSGLSNFGVFKINGKSNAPDPDKKNTINGQISITLNIGGI